VIVREQSDNIQLQDLRRLAEHVQEYQKLKHVIHNGFPVTVMNYWTNA